MIMGRTLADRLMLFPSKGPAGVEGVTREHIAMAGGVLEMWSARSAAAMDGLVEKFVLCFHGNASRADKEFKRMPRIWGRLPIEFCAINYPGFGGSSGVATLASLGNASLAGFDAVAERASDRPIFLSGHSMGTVPALFVAARRKAAGLLLHNPPPLRELAHGRFGWWNLWLGSSLVARGVPAELNSIKNAARASAPVVFLLAARDGLVTPKYQRLIVDAYGGPKRIVDLPNARHDTAVQEEDLPMVNPAIDWLWNFGRGGEDQDD